MAILYTWRLNCRKWQLSSWICTSLRPRSATSREAPPVLSHRLPDTPVLREEPAHASVERWEKARKQETAMEGLLPWLHTQTPAGAGEGSAELGTRAESITTLPWSQLLQGTSWPCSAGEAPPPSPRHRDCKTEPLPPSPGGSMAPVCLRSWALTSLTLPRWWQQSVKPITLNYFYSWL